MKKVLIVAHLQSHIINFHLPVIKYLQEQGYIVYVATRLNRERYSYLDQELKEIIWVDISFNRNPFSKNSFISVRQLVDLMKNNKFDFIHTNTPIASFLTRLAGKITKSSPVLYTAHGFHFFEGAPLKNWIIYYSAEKIASRWTDALITMNEEDYMAAKNKLKIRNNKVYKINGVGVDIEKYFISDNKDLRYKESIGLSSEDFVITMIGEINDNKNQIQILKAMKSLKNINNIKLLIVGEGENREKLEVFIKENNLSKNVIFLGFRQDIPKILNITDILASLSAREGLPKNILEAMAAKTPIIATNIRGNKDLVVNMENGILVNYGDVESTSNAIELLFRDEKLFKTMSLSSFEKSMNYSTDIVLKQLEDIYSDFIDVK